MKTWQADATARRSWWAAVAVVAATYAYFLLFAEFALLELAQAQLAAAKLRMLLAALGAGGLAGAAGAWRLFRPQRASALLRAALAGCAVAGGSAVFARGLPALGAVFAGTGLSLGALTVVLAASLRRAMGLRRLGLGIGLGTGLAYGACNLPAVFTAEPRWQALGAAAAVLLAAAAVGWLRTDGEVDAEIPARPAAARWLLALLALVWLDSAAFYVIQHTDALRHALWQGSATLWGNAATHVVFAVVAGVALDRGWMRAPAVVAIGLLALAVWQLAEVATVGMPPQWLYTAGVSLYSVVLVHVPAKSANAGWAALVFGVAGWVGSALGIGLAQDLHGVPVWFAALAAAAVGVALAGCGSRGEAAKLGRGALAVAAGVAGLKLDAAEDLIARGREVYVREGCLHCHSQFVRPQVPEDVWRWGPAPEMADARGGEPPLLGNRRQGPDLANVGTRRSLEWNRLHLQQPRAVRPGSRMPSYAHLFRGVDSEGDALVRYLASLGVERLEERLTQVRRWAPAARAPLELTAARRVFGKLCATCHGAEGRGDGVMARALSVAPPNWPEQGWRHVPSDEGLERELSRIIKFGLPGSPMAGYEYLPDDVIVGLARLVRTWQKQERSRSAE